MKTIIFFTLLAILTVSCASNPTFDKNALESAVAATIASLPTGTLQPTYTPAPTYTQAPTYTKEPEVNPSEKLTSVPTEAIIERLQNESLEVTRTFLMWTDEIDSINLLRFNNGTFEIDVNTKEASKESQPKVSFEIVQGIASTWVPGFGSEAIAAQLAGGTKFFLKLVTYSVNGDYRFESLTDYRTLEKVYNKQISFDEWFTAANAGFK